MGKVKNSRKKALQISPAQSSSSITGLESDLASLDENKRQKGCMLLADLYSFNIANKFSLETLTSSAILSKLAMRLVDCSERVRTEAATALRCLAECKEKNIVKKLVNTGIIKTAVSLAVESLSCSNILKPTMEYAQQLFHVIANSISVSSSACSEVLKTTSCDFISFLFASFAFNMPIDIIGACVNILNVMSTRCTSVLINSNRVGVIWNFVDTIYQFSSSSTATTTLTAPNVNVHAIFALHPLLSESEKKIQAALLSLECLEVISNIFIHSHLSSVAVEGDTAENTAATLSDLCRINHIVSVLYRSLEISNEAIKLHSATGKI